MHHPFGMKKAVAAGLAALAFMGAFATSCRAQAGYPDSLRSFSDNGSLPFHIGTAVTLQGGPSLYPPNGYQPGLLTGSTRDRFYHAMVRRQFNQIEPGNELKMMSVWTKGAARISGHYVALTNLTDKDGTLAQACSWAEAKSPRLTVRGHVMVYYTDYTLPTFPNGQQPLFIRDSAGKRVLNKAAYTPNDLRDLLQSYVRQVVDATMAQNAASRTRYHYRVVQMWDVTNEVVSDDPSDPEVPGAGFAYRHDDPWFNNGPVTAAGGYDYVPDLYRWAGDEMRANIGKTIGGYKITAADKFKLYYNDYSAEWNPDKAKRIMNLIHHADSGGGHVDGEGFQAHVLANGLNPQFRKSIADAVAAGLRFSVTEADCAIKETPGSNDPSLVQQEINQGREMGEIARYCVEQKQSCDCFQIWGATDDGSWIANQEATPFTRWIPDSRPGPTHGTEGYWPKEGQYASATLFEPATGKLKPNSGHKVSDAYAQILAALKSKR